MLSEIKIWSISKKWFWKLRNKFARIGFQFEKFIHHRKSNFQIQITKTNIGRQLFFIGLQKFLIIGLSIFCLERLEKFIVDQYHYKDWPIETAINDYNGQLELYAVLLATIFSIYFATIGIILSTGYARLNRDIISLLIGEQIGSVYTLMLVSATAFCLTVTALNIFDYQTGMFVYLTATFLTTMSVLLLFPMGQRLFSFFELAPLIEIEILPKIVQSIDNVSKTGSTISFQNHFSLEAQSRITQLFYIDDTLQLNRGKLNQNLPLLTKQHSSLLIHYLKWKHQIPKNSYWYPRKLVHKDWFLAGDTSTNLALSTGSQIEPEKEPDLEWLEKKLLKRIHNHLEKTLKMKDWDLALKLLWQMSHRTLECAKGFYFSTGLQDIKETKSLFEKHLANSSGNDEEQMQVVALSDAWAVATHNFFLETLRRIQTFDEELIKFFEKDDWSRSASKNLPTFLQQRISYLQDRIEFEQKNEGRRLSQPKYLQQLTIKAVLEYYSEIFETIALNEPGEFISFANKLLEFNYPSSASHVILTAFHANWKLPHWFSELDILLKKYAKYEKYNDDDYTLPKIDVEKIQSILEQGHDQLITKLLDKNLSKHLYDFKDNNFNIPDHFGQTYYILAEECFSALSKNDSDKFARIFHTFLKLSLMADSVKFQDPSLDVSSEFRLSLISTANKDIATILGYSILYSEYFNCQELQNTAISIWEKMYEGVEDKKKYWKRMLLVSDSYRFSLNMPIRSDFRMRWKMSFENKLREDGFGDHLHFSECKVHPSDIVDEFRSTFYDASDVFFALKIVDKVELTDEQINHQIKSYKDQLTRRREAQNEI